MLPEVGVWKVPQQSELSIGAEHVGTAALGCPAEQSFAAKSGRASHLYRIKGMFYRIPPSNNQNGLTI
jgi:hypothetical protein